MAASRSRRASRRRTCSSSRTACRSSSGPTARARRGQPVPAGYVFVDGLSVGDVGEIVLRDRRALANDGMFMVVVTVDKQTGKVIGRPEIITRGFVHGNEQDPIIDEADPAGHGVGREPGRPHQRDRAAEEPDQGRRVALPVRADEAPADGLPGRGRGLGGDAAPAHDAPEEHVQPADDPAAGRRAATSRARSSGSRCSSSPRSRSSRSCPARARSRRGSSETVGPWFGSLRWLLPFLLLATGWYIEWGPGKAPGSGWGLTLLGVAIAYAGPARRGVGRQARGADRSAPGGGLVGDVHGRRPVRPRHAGSARSSCSSPSASRAS